VSRPRSLLPWDECDPCNDDLRETETLDVRVGNRGAGHGFRTWTARRSELPVWPGKSHTRSLGAAARSPSVFPRFPSFPVVSDHDSGHDFRIVMTTLRTL